MKFTAILLLISAVTSTIAAPVETNSNEVAKRGSFFKGMGRTVAVNAVGGATIATTFKVIEKISEHRHKEQTQHQKRDPKNRGIISTMIHSFAGGVGTGAGFATVNKFMEHHERKKLENEKEKWEQEKADWAKAHPNNNSKRDVEERSIGGAVAQGFAGGIGAGIGFSAINKLMHHGQ